MSLGKIKKINIPWPHSQHKERPLDVILTRFRLGHTKLNGHMAAKGLRDSPNCTQCDLQVNEDTQHYLLHCTGYNDIRQTMKENLSQIGVTNMTIPVLLGSSDYDDKTKHMITDEIGRFITKTTRINDL